MCSRTVAYLLLGELSDAPPPLDLLKNLSNALPPFLRQVIFGEDYGLFWRAVAIHFFVSPQNLV